VIGGCGRHFLFVLKKMLIRCAVDADFLALLGICDERRTANGWVAVSGKARDLGSDRGYRVAELRAEMNADCSVRIEGKGDAEAAHSIWCGGLGAGGCKR
jgi:hypothetical protein